MGLFDGAGDGQGSTADLASLFDLPVVLVVDVRGMARLGGRADRGLHPASRRRRDRRHRASTGSPAPSTRRCSGAPATTASRSRCWPACRAIPQLELPARHLGLVPAAEVPELEPWLDRAAEIVGANTDLDRLIRLARPFGLGLYGPPARPLRPLGQRIAVASDLAFAFAYPATLEGWRIAGAEILPFAPLADQPPDPGADAVYLPGGYPELHAGRLAANRGFHATACAPRRPAARSSTANAAATWRSGGRLPTAPARTMPWRACYRSPPASPSPGSSSATGA